MAVRREDVIIARNHTTPSDEIYANHFIPGIYTCSRCGNELYRSEDKYIANNIWPAFREPIHYLNAIDCNEESVEALNLTRTEIVCNKCKLHLGHLFEDGRLSGDTHPSARYRHCILSSALKFKPYIIRDPSEDAAIRRDLLGSLLFLIPLGLSIYFAAKNR